MDQNWKASRTQESVILEHSLSTMSHANVISNMTHNEDYNTMSQIAVVNSSMLSGFDMDNDVDVDDVLEEDGSGDEYADEMHNYTQEARPPIVDGDEAPPHEATEVPLTFTSLEGINMIMDGNWTMSQFKTIMDLTLSWKKILLKIKNL